VSTRNRVSTEADDAILAEGLRLREEAGMTARQISERLGGTEGAWAWRFLVHGVERGGIPRYRPEVKTFDDQIAAMRCQGLSLPAIAAAIGKPHPYALHRLVRIARRQAWDEAQCDPDSGMAGR
jgi:DNA-binding transcriptional MerR regulator